MKRLVILILVLFPIYGLCQTLVSGSYLNINNVNALINPVGNQFYDFEGNNCFEVPSGSGKHTIFNSSLWFGGKDVNYQLKCAAELTRQNGADFYPGPLITSGSEIGTCSYETSQAWDTCWRMTRADVDEFLLCYSNTEYPNYLIPESILDWPANGDIGIGQAQKLAPYFDSNEDDYYDPSDGDYPIIRGDDCLFFIFNDKANIHTETGGDAIGLEVHGMAYAFNCDESGALSNTLFFNYKIINRSTYILFDFYTGIYTDFDVGNASDDYVGCDVNRGLYYAYNGDDYDESDGETIGYEEQLPVQATMIIRGLRADSDGMDNSNSMYYNGIEHVVDCDEGDILNGNINGMHYEDGIIDNELYGMTRFSYFSNNGEGTNNNTLNPQSSLQFYNYMSGYWLDNTPICYGGTGHYSGGANTDITAKFAFPGNPTTDPCGWGQGGVTQGNWSEEIEANIPGDRKGVGVSGPMTILPSQELDLDVAYIFAQSDDGTSFSSIDLMKSYADTIKWAFTHDITPCGTSFVYNTLPENDTDIGSSISIYPNPANNTLILEFGAISDYQIQVLDIQGKVFLTENVSGDIKVLDISSLSEGVYFVRISDGKFVENRKLVVLR